MRPFKKKPSVGKGAMTASQVADALAPWYEANSRPAWRPVISDRVTRTAKSFFGGTPWLREGDQWPSCGGCSKRLILFLQIDSEELPSGFRTPGKGLFQFYYCVECDEEGEETWNPYSECHAFRHIRGDAGPATNRANPKPLKKIVIERWEPFADWPDYEDWGPQGLAVTFWFPKKPKPGGQPESVEISCPSIGYAPRRVPYNKQLSEDVLIERLNRCSEGDKLGGWPKWVQGAEWPECRKCSAKMEHVFQLDYQGNLDHLFGDAGCGHIFRCPKHRDVFAFGWDCC